MSKSIKNIPRILDLTLPTYKVPMFIGVPGIGKTSIINQYCEKKGWDIETLILSQIDSVDVRGIPRTTEEGICKWFAPEFLPFEGNPFFENRPEGILFLDEMNRASRDVLQSVFQLILERRIGNHVIMPGWKIVSAGNLGIEDMTDVNDFDSALNDRIIKVKMDVDVSAWIDWAKSYGLNEYIIRYIEKNPSNLFIEENKQESLYITPRTWHRFSDIINGAETFDEFMEIVEFIGDDVIHSKIAPFIDFINHEERIMKTEDLMKIKDETYLKQRLRSCSSQDKLKISQELVEFIKNTAISGEKNGSFEFPRHFLNNIYVMTKNNEFFALDHKTKFLNDINKKRKYHEKKDDDITSDTFNLNFDKATRNIVLNENYNSKEDYNTESERNWANDFIDQFSEFYESKNDFYDELRKYALHCSNIPNSVLRKEDRPNSGLGENIKEIPQLELDDNEYDYGDDLDI